MKLARTLCYLSLATVMVGVLWNFKDIQRYIRISSM
jgi:hypothetical protein